jgi:hypothetical protein
VAEHGELIWVKRSGSGAGAWDGQKSLGVVVVQQAWMGVIARAQPALAARRIELGAAPAAAARSPQRDCSSRMPRALFGLS